MNDLVIVAYGQPAPQGSKNVNKHGATYESSKYVKPWREAVKAAARDAMWPGWTPLDGPVHVTVTFTFTRPQGHWRTGRNAHLLRDTAPRYPQGIPDLSKLIRSTEDALTDAGVWKDDARVVDVTAAKRYVGDVPDVLSIPGAVIRVRTLAAAVQPALGEVAAP